MCSCLCPDALAVTVFGVQTHRAYFAIFWIFAQLLIGNIMMAVILDMFTILRPLFISVDFAH